MWPPPDTARNTDKQNNRILSAHCYNPTTTGKYPSKTFLFACSWKPTSHLSRKLFLMIRCFLFVFSFVRNFHIIFLPWSVYNDFLLELSGKYTSQRSGRLLFMVFFQSYEQNLCFYLLSEFWETLYLMSLPSERFFCWGGGGNVLSNIGIFCLPIWGYQEVMIYLFHRANGRTSFRWKLHTCLVIIILMVITG